MSVRALEVQSSTKTVQVSRALNGLQAQGVHTSTSGATLGVEVAGKGRGGHQDKAQSDESELAVHCGSVGLVWFGSTFQMTTDVSFLNFANFI